MRSERGAKKEKEKRKLSTALGCIPLTPSPLTEPRRILRESRALHVKKRSHFLEDDNPAHSRRRYNEIGGNALSTVGRDPCLCRFGARDSISRSLCLDFETLSPEFDRGHKGARLHLVDIVNAKAGGTLNRILTLLKSVKDRRLRNAVLIHITPVSRVIEAIEKGNLKFAIKSAIDAGNKDQGGVGEKFRSQSKILEQSQAGNEAQRCRNSFGKRRRTPISYRNKAVHDLSAVLQSIASLLL
ncbi:hypothetical protein Gotur_029952 [Gossypium turneri]